MVTIKDIARASGVSASTVSRALADSELIPEHTRNKIKKKADELCYIPNIAAINLKTKKSWNIGIISFVEEKLGFSHYLFANILNSFIKGVEVHNYDITLLSRQLLNNDGNLIGHCKGRNLDGVLILCADTSVKQIQELLKSDIPVVAIDNFDENIVSTTHCITSDNRAKMFELTEYVLSMGHKNIVYICGQDIFVTRERVKGYKAALKLNGIEFTNEMLVESHYYNYEHSQNKINEVLDRKNPPTCVLLPDDYAAIKAYETIRMRGLKIGEDISIAGFDGLEMTQLMLPKLTTVYQNTEKIGETAAATLLKSINNIETTFLEIIPATLIKGQSVCKIS